MGPLCSSLTTGPDRVKNRLVFTAEGSILVPFGRESVTETRDGTKVEYRLDLTGNSERRILRPSVFVGEVAMMPYPVFD